MCGRYTLGNTGTLFDRFLIEGDDSSLQVRYNVAPSQVMPVVTLEEERRLKFMKWGPFLQLLHSGRRLRSVPGQPDECV